MYSIATLKKIRINYSIKDTLVDINCRSCGWFAVLWTVIGDQLGTGLLNQRPGVDLIVQIRMEYLWGSE
jgi:hypothetical protein